MLETIAKQTNHNTFLLKLKWNLICFQGWHISTSWIICTLSRDLQIIVRLRWIERNHEWCGGGVGGRGGEEFNVKTSLQTFNQTKLYIWIYLVFKCLANFMA